MRALLPYCLAFLLHGAVLLNARGAEPSAGAPPNANRDVGTQKEGDWVDNRWGRTDVGPFLSSIIETPSGSVAKGITIRIGAQNEGAVCFDTAHLAWRAAWTGGFLKFDAARFGLIKPPAIDGRIAFTQPASLRQPGWLGTTNHYVGLHVHGKRVILEYRVDGMRVLDSPWLETAGDSKLFTRSLELGPSDRETRIVVAQASGEPLQNTPLDDLKATSGAHMLRYQDGTNRTFIFLKSTRASLQNHNGQQVIRFPAHKDIVRAKVVLWSGDAEESLSQPFLEKIAASEENLVALSAPGPARWLPELQTVGQRGFDTDFLAVDTLTIPYDNPWKALMFLAGVDFTADGTVYVCTIHGDVWRVSGADANLRRLKWKRFATGLHQPLGLKVRDGEVFVLGRDQITRLRDGNQDGEADFYENFCNHIETSTGRHDFVTCLEQDDGGNFYYVDPSGVHRVSRDGASVETIATGWRNPNGLGVSPDGKIITVAPQQGEWTPSSQISEAKSGGFYGYHGPQVSAERPLGYDAPLCWIPHEVDNSSGSQVWVPPASWGPLGGHMIHLLWGRCGLMLVVRDVVDGVPQAAVAPLPGRLLSGPNRGTFSARDGSLYIAGSTGWQTSAARDGALQRIRFTGKPACLPVGWHARTNGIEITFSAPLETAAANDAGSFAVAQWNYRYAAQYGSKDWSVANPERQGRDVVEVKSARLLPDGRTVFLETPMLVPVMQMEVKYSLNTPDGKPLRSQFWLTLNKLP
jgi:hypothetical protein